MFHTLVFQRTRDSKFNNKISLIITILLFFFFIYNSASAWAIAAERLDLLDKSLNNLIKYFICSEHFTNDCFLDPPYNTKLKKTSRPVSAPIPTIFKCNFFIQNLNNVKTSKIHSVKPYVGKTSDELDSHEKITHIIEENKTENLEETIIGPQFNTFDIQNTDNDTSSFLLDIEAGYETSDDCSEIDIQNGNELPPIYLLQSNDLNENAKANDMENENICRLCAKVFDYSDELIKLFTDNHDDIATTYLENVVPNTVCTIMKKKKMKYT